MKPQLYILSTAILLAACGSGVPKPPTVTQVQAGGGWFRLEERDAGGSTVQNSLLAVEQGAGRMRFVQTDPLGAPLARQVLDKSGWRNDGFIMPNTAARRLFAAMLPLLAADAAVYPDLQYRASPAGGGCYLKHGRTQWCSTPEGSGWLITFPGRTQWLLEPVSD